MKKCLFICLVWLSLGGHAAEPPFWPCTPDGAEPFGRVTERDQDMLVSLASANGLDLIPTLEKVYAGDKEALAKMFQLSSQLKSLDTHTRAYGALVNSIFLNLGESKGPDFIISVVVSQEPAVRQRIRDFLIYPVFCVPKEQRAEAERSAREQFPLLWPPDFVFGKDDPLFSKTPNNPIKLSARPVTHLAVASCAPVRPAAYRVRWAAKGMSGA